MAADRQARGRGRPRTGVRESLLAAAAQVLDQAGPAGFSTKAVALRAGVAESSIFYHFGDRLGLLQEIIFAEVGGYQQLIDELTGEHGPADLATGLRRTLDFLERYFVRLLPGMTAMQADPQTLAAFQERNQGLDLGPHRAILPVQEYLRHEQAAGRVSADADLAAVATFTVGAAFQRALRLRFGGSARALPSHDRLVRQLMLLLET